MRRHWQKLTSDWLPSDWLPRAIVRFGIALVLAVATGVVLKVLAKAGTPLVVLACIGVFFIALGLTMRGARALSPSATKQRLFPDVEIHIAGRANCLAHGVLALHRVRITNHETDRATSLTFRVYAKLKPESFGGVEELPLFPVYPTRPPALAMPVEVPPQRSVTGDLPYRLPEPPIELLDEIDPFRLVVEDHLSDKREDVSMDVGALWRGARR